MSFQFATPWVLIIAFLLPASLAAYYLMGQRNHRPATLQHATTALAAGLHRSWRVAWRPALIGLRLLTIFMALIALSRPQIVQGRETITGEGIDIALVLDISGSMASLDFEPSNRLEAARQVIGNFIDERPYDNIGLVVFASEAFSQSPLTLDHQMVSRTLEQVELATDLGIEDGTAIGSGIANAASMLVNQDAESKVIVLLTDGVNNAGQIDPLTAAEAAKALGIKIYTIGAARPGLVPVPVDTIFGGQRIVQQESVLDEATLQQVASITGGKYFRAEDTTGLRDIYDDINELEKSQVEIQVFNQYQELAGWLLIPALFLFLLEMLLRHTLFRRIP